MKSEENAILIQSECANEGKFIYHVYAYNVNLKNYNF